MRFSNPSLFPRLSLGLNHLKKQQDSILSNGDKLTKMPQLGGAASPPGEAAAIIFLEGAESFYDEIREIIFRYCEKNKFNLSTELLDELILYQKPDFDQSRLEQWLNFADRDVEDTARKYTAIR